MSSSILIFYAYYSHIDANLLVIPIEIGLYSNFLINDIDFVYDVLSSPN